MSVNHSKNKELVQMAGVFIAVITITYFVGSFVKPNLKAVASNSNLNRKLMAADELAKFVIERAHYEYPERLREMGMIFDANLEPDYADILEQMDAFRSHSEGTARASIMEAFGYESGRVIWYLLENYDEWAEMKGVRQ